MRERERIKRITKLIEELWEIYPDMRLGQLLENYVFEHKVRAKSHCIFHQEDDITEEKLKKALANPEF